jgi:HK97 family phage prohead protease
VDHLAFPAEYKLSSAETGVIEGLAAVFHNVDSHGDKIVPGAFKASLAERRSPPRMLMQHGAVFGADPRPVGVWTEVGEDTKGLRVRGRLVGLDTETGRFNLALVRDGAMRGLSIGYKVRPDGVVYGKSVGEPKRTLRSLDLHEVSIVDEPSNPDAVVTSIKAAAEIKSAREFEEFLHDSGFPKAAAKKLAAGWSAMPGEDDEQEQVNAIAAAIEASTARWKGH